ncbi:MAG: type II secretion system F family protein [Spirochaetes bacterium]|nr:type II secretion system F family protein [Spirochaetota bacterium]
MPVYVCRVADAKGQIGEFLREAASEESCLREVTEKHPYVLSIVELPEGRAERLSRRCSRRLVQDLTEMLALTLASGLSLRDALEVAQTVFPRGEGNELVALLRERLSRGGSFTEALETAGAGFPPLYTGMVRVGERIGSLDQVFGLLSASLKREKTLRNRFSSALIYPAIVLGVAVLSAVFIVAVLFPRLREIFGQLGPAAAGNVESLMNGLGTALTVVGSVLCLLIALCAGVLAARRRGGRPAVRIDRFLLAVPLVSTFFRQRELLNFTFAMEALTAAGVGVEEALAEGAGVLTNLALAEEVRAIREHVLRGERISEAFAASELFPDRIARWMAIGERVGHVEKVFGQLRAYYQMEVDKWIDRLMALIEPALIAGLGILMIAFVVFFIIPVFSLYGTIL